MKFVTDFNISGPELKYTSNPVIDHRKSCAEDELGRSISSAFDFKKLGTIEEESGLAGMYQVLEIEAFPTDKWIKFKDGIAECIEQAKANNYPPMFALLSIGNLLKELEANDAKKEPL